MIVVFCKMKSANGATHSAHNSTLAYLEVVDVGLWWISALRTSGLRDIVHVEVIGLLSEC